VNKITPYEIKIAEQLQQLPVPDMADSIWASIELQLNADLVANQKATQKPAKGKPGLGKGFYLFIITAIIIIAIVLYKNKKEAKKNNSQPPPPKTAIVNPVADSVSKAIDPAKNNIPMSNDARKKDSTAIPFIPGKRMSFDAPTQQSLPLSNADSLAAILKNKPSLPSFDSLNLPLKKPGGVKGISDSDYRIIGTKDSTKRGGG